MQTKSEQGACLAEIQARTARKKPGMIAVAEIAEEVRFNVAFGKELLSAIVALACRKERFVDLGVIEP